MARYDDFVSRKRREHGERFDPSDLHPQFVEHFNAGHRIKVKGPMGERTGRVGATTRMEAGLPVDAPLECHGVFRRLEQGGSGRRCAEGESRIRPTVSARLRTALRYEERACGLRANQPTAVWRARRLRLLQCSWHEAG